MQHSYSPGTEDYMTIQTTLNHTKTSLERSMVNKLGTEQLYGYPACVLGSDIKTTRLTGLSKGIKDDSSRVKSLVKIIKMRPN